MDLHHISLWQIELFPWYAFLIVWCVSAVWVKKTKTTESIQSRLAYGVPMVAGCYLIFAHSMPSQLLSARFVPSFRSIQIAAIMVTCLGTALCIWARFILGENWSARVTRKVGHELVRTGPYAYVRHPIYTGLTLAMLGTATFVGEWRALLGVGIAVTGEILKARREEQFMIAEFGATYEQYRGSTGFLLPRF